MPEFTKRIRSAWDALRGVEAPYRGDGTKAAGRGTTRGNLGTVPVLGYGAYGGMGGWGDYPAGAMLSGQPGDVDPVAGIPLHQNVVVTAAVNWLARNFPVPDLTVVRDDGADADSEIADHWLIDLLDRPNETRDFFSFFHQCVLSDVTDGNTFILKRKDGSGQVVDLWWLPPWSVWPVPDATRKKALDHYEYRSGRDVEVFRPDEILHIVNRPPTDGSLRGSTPLISATRSVSIINRIELYDDSLLMNFGAASHMISPRDPDAQIQTQDLDAIRSWWAAKHTGRGAGKPLVAPRGLMAERIGFSPDEMAIEKMPHRHVAHILSTLGLSPMVLGLPDESKTYANLSEANRAAYENALMPMLARLCEGFNHDEDLIADGERLKPDYSHVPCLQDDRAVKIHSLVEAKTVNILDEDECRAEIHYPPRTDAQKEASKPPAPVVPPPQTGLGAGQEPGDGANGDGAKPEPAPGANGKSAGAIHPRFSTPTPHDPDAALRSRADRVLAAIEAKLGGDDEHAWAADGLDDDPDDSDLDSVEFHDADFEAEAKKGGKLGGGRWVTIGHRHVYIRGGKVVAGHVPPGVKPVGGGGGGGGGGGTPAKPSKPDKPRGLTPEDFGAKPAAKPEPAKPAPKPEAAKPAPKPPEAVPKPSAQPAAKPEPAKPAAPKPEVVPAASKPEPPKTPSPGEPAAPKGGAFTDPNKKVTVGQERKMDAALEHNFRDQIDNLTPAQAKAVNSYSGLTGYHEVNGALRRGNTDARVEHIDSAINSGGLKHDIVLYRGVNNHADLGMAAGHGAVGSTVRDKGYISTSLNHEVSSGFATHRAAEPVMFRIKAKAGQKAITTDIRTKGHDSEHEVLLPRNTGLKITKYHGQIGGVHHYDAVIE